MSTDRYPYLSDNVKQQIANGQVPPPRDTTDAPDPIRDLRLAMAVAQDNGDGAAVDRLNTQWIAALRNGAVSTWEPPKAKAGRDPSQPHTRDGLLHAARKAEQDGDHDRAHTLKVRAMHAPDADTSKLLNDANTLDAAGTDFEGSQRLKAQALQALRGELPPPPPVPAPRGPETAQEFNAAIAEADAAGDTYEGGRLRLGLLALNRAAREGGSMDLQ